jgi:signal transduction histidine kinase/sensor domain CHASE-containing protein/ActR/RegA family two-component response regulator
MTTLVLLITLYVTLKSLYKYEVIQLENEQIIEDTDRVLANLEKRMFSRLEMLAKNYGEWDPTYEFIDTYDQSYIKVNFNEKFLITNKIYFVAIVNTQGELVFWQSLNNIEEHIKLNKEIKKYLLKNTNQIAEGVTGIKTFGEVPSIIASSQILKNSGAGSPKGSIVIGRLINDETLVEISNMENTYVSFEDVGQLPIESSAGYHISKNNTFIFAKTTLVDIDGQPAINMIVSEKRDIIKRLNIDLSSLLIIIIFLGSIFSVILFLLLKTFILNKISRLTDKVNEISRAKRINLIHYSGNDEVAQLAEKINNMLFSLEKVNTEKKRDDELYRSILYSISDGLLVYDNNNRCKLANRNASKITEIDDKEIITKLTNRDYPWELINEKGEELEAFDLPVTRALQTEETTVNQIIGLKFTEKIKWIAVNAVPFYKFDHSNINGVILTFKDVSELQEQRSKLIETNSFINSLIQNLNSGILFVDNNGIVQWVNKKLTRMLGKDFSAENMINTPDYQHRKKFSLLLENSDEFNRKVDKIIDERRDVSGEVLKFKDGRVLLLDHVLVTVDGEYKGNLWQFTEVTDKINFERSLLLAKEEAEKANKIKSEFIAKISHELRTPLNGMMGFAQLLLYENKQPLNKIQKENVKEILHAGTLLTNLINDMLNISQIEAGMLRVELKRMEVISILKESINLMTPYAKEKRISVEMILDNCKDTFIMVDPVRFNQVLFNLVSNGIKYNKPNGKLYIYCESDETNIFIHFKDNGIGIEQENLELIFEPFTRLDENKEGSGIGLFLVKQLIEQMNGHIAVSSELGKGSTFTISFPIIKSKEKTNDLMYNREAFEDITLPNCEILYIEDNEANIHIMKKLFKEMGEIALYIEKHGKSGIKAARELLPDVILLDLSLPDIDGLEVLKILKASDLTKNIPVIIVTAQTITNEIRFKLNNYGCFNIISKPFEFNGLLKIIQNVVNKK